MAGFLIFETHTLWIRCGKLSINFVLATAALDSISELSNPLDTWRKEDQDN